MAVALICTIGVTTPAQGDLLAALSREIRLLSPRFTGFITTVESGDNAQRIGEMAGIPQTEMEVVMLRSAHDLNETFHSVNDLIRELHQRGFSNENIYINYTGGTKVMSSGAVLAAVFNQCRELRYLYEAAPENEQLVSTHPQAVFAFRDLLLARRLIREMRFQSARDLLSRLDLSYLGDYERTAVESLRKIAIGYSCWDNFHYREYLEITNDLPLDLDTLESFHVAVETREKLAKLADEVNEGQYSPLIFAEMFNNSLRRKLEAKIDDAVTRIYRALEMLAQWLLARHGIDTNDLDTRKVPPRYRVHFEAMRSMDDGVVRIGMRKSFELLSLLEEPVGRQYTSNSVLGQTLHRRSHSILAHGTSSMKVEEYEQLAQAAQELFVMEIPDFPTICSQLQFPWIKETI
jgi:CRISPR-associated protein (TIGR02710 family)